MGTAVTDTVSNGISRRKFLKFVLGGAAAGIGIGEINTRASASNDVNSLYEMFMEQGKKQYAKQFDEVKKLGHIRDGLTVEKALNEYEKAQKDTVMQEAIRTTKDNKYINRLGFPIITTSCAALLWRYADTAEKAAADFAGQQNQTQTPNNKPVITQKEQDASNVLIMNVHKSRDGDNGN